jgi:hypothetical protein
VTAPDIRDPGTDDPEISSHDGEDEEEHLGEMVRMAWWLVWLEDHEHWWAREQRWRREGRSL